MVVEKKPTNEATKPGDKTAKTSKDSDPKKPEEASSKEANAKNVVVEDEDLVRYRMQILKDYEMNLLVTIIFLIFKSDEDRQLKDELLLCVERLKVNEKRLFFPFLNLYVKSL